MAALKLITSLAVCMGMPFVNLPLGGSAGGKCSHWPGLAAAASESNDAWPGVANLPLGCSVRDPHCTCLPPGA
eukprot:2677831-Karenia_brevis.AAC.1